MGHKPDTCLALTSNWDIAIETDLAVGKKSPSKIHRPVNRK